jgi:hypothetical protein
MKEIKWVCINNKRHGNLEHQLTIGKTYTEIESNYVDLNCILIENDLGWVVEYYQPTVFVRIDEWREMQLKKLDL